MPRPPCVRASGCGACSEEIEDPLEKVRRDPEAVVPHAEDGLAAPVIQADPDVTVRRRVFQRVLKKIRARSARGGPRLP